MIYTRGRIQQIKIQVNNVYASKIERWWETVLVHKQEKYFSLELRALETVAGGEL